MFSSHRICFEDIFYVFQDILMGSGRCMPNASCCVDMLCNFESFLQQLMALYRVLHSIVLHHWVFKKHVLPDRTDLHVSARRQHQSRAWMRYLLQQAFELFIQDYPNCTCQCFFKKIYRCLNNQIAQK